MFGKKADDKIAKKQAEQEAKDKAAMEKFGVDFDSYTSDDIKEKNVASLKEICIQSCRFKNVFFWKSFKWKFK